MKKSTVYRLAALVVVMSTLAFLAAYTPLGQYFKFHILQDAMLNAGAWGVALFIVAFVVGTLLNLPGFLFIILSFLVYGFGWGLPIAYVGALLSVLTHFVVVRTIGGQALGEIKNKMIRKVMKNFDSHPVRTVIILRLLFFISPPVNYVLALSNVRIRQFVIGTLLGNIIPLGIQALLLYFAKDFVMNKIM